MTYSKPPTGSADPTDLEPIPRSPDPLLPEGPAALWLIAIQAVQDVGPVDLGKGKTDG